MIKLFEKFKFYKKGLKITYSAVVLDSKSKELLLSTFVYSNPDYVDWIKHADHSTICLGELPEHLKRYWLDEKVTLTANQIGYSDKSVAVKVTGLFTISKPSDLEDSKFPHITLAINPINGKPADSNKIENWEDIEPLVLNGVVKEILR